MTLATSDMCSGLAQVAATALASALPHAPRSVTWATQNSILHHQPSPDSDSALFDPAKTCSHHKSLLLLLRKLLFHHVGDSIRRVRSPSLTSTGANPTGWSLINSERPTSTRSQTA